MKNLIIYIFEQDKSLFYQLTHRQHVKYLRQLDRVQLYLSFLKMNKINKLICFLSLLHLKMKQVF